MKSEMTFPKIKRLLFGAVAICVILIAGTAIWSQSGKVAQAAIINPPSPSLPAGLVGWWRFDEGIGSVANDSSGNGNNGAIYGGTWVSGKYGTALSFNGASSYVQVPDSASLQFGNGSFTISAWIKPRVFSDRAPIVIKSDWPGTYYLFDINSANGLHFEVFDGSNGAGGGVNNTLSVDTWAYVTLVVDRSNKVAVIYVDGSQAGDQFDISGVTGSISPTSPLYIGAGHITTFNGIMDEVRTYNRALSPTEVQADFLTSPGFITTKIPAGTTQVIVTLAWQGTGSINATITSPSQSYTEDQIPVYAKTTYSTSGGGTGMLNVKRLSVSVSPLSTGQTWTIALTYDTFPAYQITVEVQK